MQRIIFHCVIFFATSGAFRLAEFSARAELTTNRPFAGLICISETRTNPPERLFIAQIDLTNPRLHLHVAPGGPDPDGPGKWETTLMPPTQIAAREHFDFVINGDFFKARGVNDREGTNSGYRAGLWALATGPAMSGGRAWAVPTNARPSLVVHTNNRVTIELRRRPAVGDQEIVSGNTLLIYDGAMILHTNKVRHPRTAAGLDAAGKILTLLVVDGRKPKVAVGMSYDELAEALFRLGCYEALNLDGGGSSVMAVRDATGQMKILNEPTDGHERAVANVLGISVDQN